MTVNDNELPEGFPLIDASDVDILLQREAHFGGKFDEMLAYYEREGKGSQPFISIERIRELADIEKKAEQNIAPLILSGPEAEQIKESRDSYKALRDLYDKESTESKIPLLIADLILSEEEEADAEVEALVKQGKTAVPLLLDLLKSEFFYNSLAPGYGQAPFLAAKVLGKIGDDHAIYSIFESIGEGDEANERMLLQALKAIGKPAEEFLLKVVRSKPYNEDNEKAALALIEFSEKADVAEECFKILLDLNVSSQPVLATYLILACQGLKHPSSRERLLKLSLDPNFPKMLQRDIQALSKEWNSNSNI